MGAGVHGLVARTRIRVFSETSEVARVVLSTYASTLELGVAFDVSSVTGTICKLHLTPVSLNDVDKLITFVC